MCSRSACSQPAHSSPRALVTIVAEQEELITQRRSRFDDDVRNGERIALMIYRRLRPEEQEAVS